MTEAGTNWLVEIDKKSGRSMTHLASYDSVLRSFCNEVEKRAAFNRHYHNDLVADGLAFRALKRELVGEK